MPPTGLCTLSAWLTKLGHKVALLDLALELHVAAKRDRASMRTLTIRSIEEFRPDIVGVTSMYNNSIFAEELVRIAKLVRPSTFTVAAGPHFGANAERAVQRVPQLDAAITGEGEVAIKLIAQCIDGQGDWRQIPNLVYQHGAEIHTNKSGPLISLAEYDFNIWEACVEAGVINLEKYAHTISGKTSSRAIYVEAGRGCPFSCSFCAPAQFWDRKYRLKSPKIIADEIRFLFDSAGYNYFLLVHDLLTANRARAADLAIEIEKLQIPVQWMANSRVDIDLNPYIQDFSRSGCRKFFFGVESASNRMQSAIKKFLPEDSARKTVSSLQEHGINATCSFVIGLPDETPAELSRTLGYGAQLALTGAETIQYHRLRLFPPAPLATADIVKSFDLETLELEFPFPHADPEEIEAIKADPVFFSGYFAPASRAGTPQQLSQVELIFQQMVTLVPFTLAALHALCRDELVNSFYSWLQAKGVVPRSALSELHSPLKVWHLLRGMAEWIADTRKEDKVSYALTCAAIKYDNARLKFISPNEISQDEKIHLTDSGAYVPLNVDITRALSLLSTGQWPDPSIMVASTAIFVRTATGATIAMRARA